MAAPPLLQEQEQFDEAGYLRLHPDVAQAVASGIGITPWQHYLGHGKREGRRPNDVDADFYRRAYPQAAAELAAGAAADAAAHYLRFGRARGYRPNAAAPPPAPPAVFPWLWTDLPHAADLIEGRLRLGRLTARQAGLLHRWVRDGYVAFNDPFDPIALGAGALDLERCFAGAFPDLLFSCGAVALGPTRWQPEINPYPGAALDLHHLSRAVRDLLFAGQIAEFLGLLFDAPALLAHSRGMLRDAAQPVQRDAVGVGYTLAGQWAAAVVLLEDTDPAALSFFPGSHRLPATDGQALEQLMAEQAIQPEPVGGKRGRVVMRHPALVHKAQPVGSASTRRTLLAQYCPAYVAPLYGERVPTRMWPHGSHCFTTQHYTGIEPPD